MGVAVVGEGLLVPDRLHVPLGLDRAVVACPCELVQMATLCLAEGGDEDVGVEARQVADRGDAEPAQPFERRRPDAPQRLHRERVEELELTTGRDQHHAGAWLHASVGDARLGPLRRELGDELRGPAAHRADQIEFVGHP